MRSTKSPATTLGRSAALAGLAGAITHVAMAIHHAHHEPVMAFGLALLALVCVRCCVHLWRTPEAPAAWRDLVILAVLMAGLHLAAGATPAMTAWMLTIPLVETGLAAAAAWERSRSDPANA